MKLTIVEGNLSKRLCVYLNDRRITGRETKPLGGGTVLHEFEVKEHDIIEALGVMKHGKI